MTTPSESSRELFARLRARRLTLTFAILATLSVGILIGSVLTSTVSGKEQVDSSDARPLTIPAPVTLSNEFSKISKAISPAVVNINTVTIPKPTANRGARRNGPLRIVPPNGNGGGDGSDQNDMQDFFNRFFGGNGDDGSGDDRGDGKREALGSGFIVDPRGYIITNNHVVDKADKIYVKLSTDPDNDFDHGRPAHVVGVDPETDIAVIKIDTKEPLPTVKLGNSDGAQVGDWVLAIGSPFSLSETVTAGIVSAKNRSIQDAGGPNGAASGQFQKFIQTDAAINPGNSGGPLVDMAGQVIGMNTAIYTQSMGSQGVGFAMPSNVIANVYNDLISPSHAVVRGSIGISFQGSVSASVTREYGFANGGVLVREVQPPNGPAAKAGVKADDVIVSLDGKPVKDGDALVSDISARKVGTTVQVGILREGKSLTLPVSIADRAKLFADNGQQADNSSGPAEADPGQGKLGITVQAVPNTITSKLGIRGGVIVSSVRPGSFADDLNINRGDVITAINRRPVTDEASYRAIVSGLKSGDDVVFELRSSQAGARNSPIIVGNPLP